MRMINKYLVAIPLLILSVSCSHNESIDSRGFKYKVVDTLYEEFDNLNNLNYQILLIEMDSSYYSVKTNEYGTIIDVCRKLRVKP